MKNDSIFSKLRLLAAALALAIAPCAMAQLTMSDYSLIIRGNATFSTGSHADGAIIGGNLLGDSNLEFGAQMPSNNTVALFVGGTVANTIDQIALFNQSYYLANGANGVFLQNPGVAAPANPLLPGSINTLFQDFSNTSQALKTWVSVAPSASIVADKLTINVVAGQLNILNLSSLGTLATLNTFFGGSNKEVQVNGLVDGSTKLVINFEGTGGATTFNFKTLGLSNTTYDQVLWNVSNFSTLTLGSGADSFHGSILAPTTGIVWNANNLDGQLIADSLIAAQSREFHEFAFDYDLPPIPEPSTYGLLGVALLGGLVAFRRIRVAKAALA